MANGKKTFIFYSDWINMVREMPNEDAGELLKHILSYVNDEDPSTDNILVKMAFGHMKPMLKKDLDKWDEIREIRKKAGAKGGKANAKQKQANAKQVEAVNDNVNVNVNVNDNKNENENKKKLVLPFDSLEFKKAWENWKVYKKKEFNFNFKSLQSQQASLSELNNKSNGNENTAIEIIHQSMSNGWKGFFKLKKENNEKRNSSQSGVQYSDDFKERLLKKLQS